VTPWLALMKPRNRTLIPQYQDIKQSNIHTSLPGLPIKDCTGSCTGCAQMCTNLRTIDVTEMTFFERLYERLYLVSGVGTFVLCVNCPCTSTTPIVHSITIFRFPCKLFPRMAPQFFCLHDSPNNLAESRYPRHALPIGRDLG